MSNAHYTFSINCRFVGIFRFWIIHKKKYHTRRAPPRVEIFTRHSVGSNARRRRCIVDYHVQFGARAPTGNRDVIKNDCNHIIYRSPMRRIHSCYLCIPWLVYNTGHNCIVISIREGNTYGVDMFLRVNYISCVWRKKRHFRV